MLSLVSVNSALGVPLHSLEHSVVLDCQLVANLPVSHVEVGAQMEKLIDQQLADFLIVPRQLLLLLALALLELDFVLLRELSMERLYVLERGQALFCLFLFLFFSLFSSEHCFWF